MIKINAEIYENYSVKIEWGSFEVVSSGNRVKGISPFITFDIHDKILIGLETVIDKEPITKISDVKFKIEFNIKAKEMERLDIIIDDNVVLL